MHEKSIILVRKVQRRKFSPSLSTRLSAPFCIRQNLAATASSCPAILSTGGREHPRLSSAFLCQQLIDDLLNLWML